MRTSRAKALLALASAGAALAALGPAIGQDRPESILPPGFGEPSPPRTQQQQQPAAAAQPRQAAPSRAPVVPGQPATAVVQPLPVETPTPQPSASPTPVDPALLASYEMPPFARRSLARIGVAGALDDAIPATAFGDADGRFLETLMRRLSAPLPSRWMSILLRRTLATDITTPAGVGGADFTAERAWLLLRMGEAQAARALVQSVDRADYTPKLYQVAMNAMLATSDPAGLCPLADTGRAATAERGWAMAQAMCAALAGNPTQAASMLRATQRGAMAGNIDLLLAQKVAGAVANGRRAVTIDWAGVDGLSAWRFGLATATGVPVPDELYDAVGRQATYWRALSPAMPLVARASVVGAAAGQGVISNAALVDFYGALDAVDEVPDDARKTIDDLQAAYAGATVAARLAAIRSLWGTETVPYDRLVLTARAAGRLPVQADAAEADGLVASMLAAGLDRRAARWRGSVRTGGDGWAMLMLADPDSMSRLGYDVVTQYEGAGDAVLKRRLFFAGLAGLGRIAPRDVERGAQALDVRIGTGNAWTDALDRAAGEGQAGTVVLLSAIGMQASSWRAVPPDMLYRIVLALRNVGLDGEARMIAAEAVTRA